MRLKITKSAHSTSYQVIKYAFINGKRISVSVESLGNSNDIISRTGCSDPEKWARDYVASLNSNAINKHIETTITFNSSKSLSNNASHSYNGGYLFLQKIYYKLGLDCISKSVKKSISLSTILTLFFQDFYIQGSSFQVQNFHLLKILINSLSSQTSNFKIFTAH